MKNKKSMKTNLTKYKEDLKSLIKTGDDLLKILDKDIGSLV